LGSPGNAGNICDKKQHLHPRAGCELDGRESTSRSPSKRSSCSSPKRPRRGSVSSESSVNSNDLSRVLKHMLCSGSLVTHNVKIQTMETPASLEVAYFAKPEHDKLMPLVDGRLDPENLVNDLPYEYFQCSPLSLHRVSLLGTEWIGMRLLHSTPDQSARFCLCAAALQNLCRTMSRNIVVEVSDESGDKCCLVMAPLHDSRAPSSLERFSRFLERSASICELSRIIANEAGQSEKKVRAEIKSWCHQCSAQYGGEQKGKRTLIREVQKAVCNSFEGSLAAISTESKVKKERYVVEQLGREFDSGRSLPSAVQSASACASQRRRSAPACGRLLPPSSPGTEHRCSSRHSCAKSREPSPCCMPTLDEDRESSMGVSEEIRADRQIRAYKAKSPVRRRRHSH
jgi:hypothetical protein